MSTQGFNNDVLGGSSTLIRQAIKSPNYVIGTAGWTINKDGSAEFNNLTIRGTFMGTNFVMNASGLFFYDPSETTGNLVISLTPKAVTGPLGESVPAGLTIGKAADVQMALYRDSTAATGILRYLLNNSSFQDALIDSAIVGGTFAALNLQGPGQTGTGLKARCRIQLNSTDGSSSANVQFVYNTDAGVDKIYMFEDFGGIGISACQQITATDPATGTSDTNPAAGETWHDLRPLTNSFIGTNSGQYPPQYRKCADGDVQVYGRIKTPPTTGNYNGVVWGNLASAYRPNHPIQSFASAVADGAATPVMTINTNGDLQFNFLPASLAQTTLMVNCRFPLDNTGVIQS